MPSLGAAGAAQDEWFSKPHKRDLVGQSPGTGLRRLLNHSSCAARGLAYEVANRQTTKATSFPNALLETYR